MKKQRMIDALEADREALPVPQEQPEFSRFFSALRDVVDANLGYEARRTLDWDPYGRQFYFKQSEGVQIGRKRCSLEATFEIKMDRALLLELFRVKEEVAAWRVWAHQTSYHWEQRTGEEA